MSSFSTEIAVYFMSNKEMSYLIMKMSLYGVLPLIQLNTRHAQSSFDSY